MDVNVRGCNNSATSSETQQSSEDEMMMMDLRRGPWTVEEDLSLINYIAIHGEGRWNSLARCAGLKRTGKSCRLRWLNYLRPDVRRGNITLEEQLIILELHSRWGNRWSKIAQHLPGRTDNEIKNYWRTRVQKHAKQLQCDVNSKQFKDTMRYLWMPRLVERIQAATAAAAAANNNNYNQDVTMIQAMTVGGSNEFNGARITPNFTPENSSTAGSSESLDYYGYQGNNNNNNNNYVQNSQNAQGGYQECQASSSGCYDQRIGFQGGEQQNMWLGGEDSLENSWNVEDLWFLQQFSNNGI